MITLDTNNFVDYIIDEHLKRKREYPSIEKVCCLAYFMIRESVIAKGKPLAYCTFFANERGLYSDMVSLAFDKCIARSITMELLRFFIQEHREILEKTWKSYGDMTTSQILNQSKAEISYKTAWRIAKQEGLSSWPIDFGLVARDAKVAKAKREYINNL